MNIFIFHRDLRLTDNTSLIEQTQLYGKIIPIFIFDPKQIYPKNNKYFSHGFVKHMIYYLDELNKLINKFCGKLCYFIGNPLTVVNNLINKYEIKSIGFNYDNSVYALERDNSIINLCKKNNIDIICKQDMLLHNYDKIYKKFTPFYNYYSSQPIIKINH